MSMKNTIIISLIALLLLLAGDPSFLIESKKDVPGSLLAVLNIAGFSIYGFLLIAVLPDKFLDEVYGTSKNNNDRAIFSLALAIIYATSLSAFVVP